MLIDAHLHLDKYGDLLDEALKQIETERIFTVAIAMDVPSYLEMRKIGEYCIGSGLLLYYSAGVLSVTHGPPLTNRISRCSLSCDVAWRPSGSDL
jgi:hypothetical protein